VAYTEFYVQSTSSNLNAGSTTGDAATYTGIGDSDGTSVFTPSDGSTPANTVNAGDFASVYVTIGATVAVFVGRVTAVGAGVNGTITVSTTAKSGTFPAASAGAHTITCKVGGAWKGPNGTSGFPFGFITATLTNAAGDVPRVNGKGTSNITAAMTHALAGPVVFQGMTAVPGDGGKWTIDGGTSGASYTLLTVSSNGNIEPWDIIFQNNGATGTADGVVSSSVSNLWSRCTFANLRGSGLVTSTNNQLVQECEAYGCNQSNTAGKYGFAATGVTYFRRCISHDNAGSNSGGFLVQVAGGLDFCIADSNGGVGINLNPGGFLAWANGCDLYNNGGNGITIGPSATAVVFVQNCNLVKNGGYGIQGSGSTRHGVVRSCDFGSGTQANTSGQTNALGGVQESGSVTYAADVTPWTDPANGDFRINLAAAKGAGRGSFTQTQVGYAGMVAYPDVGAGQHRDTGGLSLGRLVGGL
jgi:hypothetical protein